jgi:hypothetical protein
MPRRSKAIILRWTPASAAERITTALLVFPYDFFIAFLMGSLLPVGYIGLHRPEVKKLSM